jgi:CRISPR system Cascade subunit CasE
MVYLSRLIVSPRCRQARSEIANPFEMHRTIARVFEEFIESEDDGRFLYRIDREPRPHALIQTKSEPDWSRLCIPADYLAAPPEVKVITPMFRSGERFVFRLRANPTLRLNGKRYGLYTHAEQVEWLARKSGLGGFQVEKLAVRQEECLEARGTGGRVAKFATVQYDGELSIADPLLFKDSFENGVGSSKGMGYGLLSLARA